MLPNIKVLSNVKEVKYLASKNELKESYQNDAFMEKLFDSTIYKLILRALHEVFGADVINAIDAISINGWVNYMNKATGNREDACITSIQVKKEAFIAIDLKNVDPKALIRCRKYCLTNSDAKYTDSYGYWRCLGGLVALCLDYYSMV